MKRKLYVVSGTGVANVNKRKHALKANTLFFIYVPPAYDREGDELPAGKPGEGEEK